MNVAKMAKSHIGTVFKQAITTFSEKSEAFNQNLEVLKSLFEKTTAEDVNLPVQFMSKSFWKKPNKAPITYVDMYEDDLLTMGIFILSDTMKLPLHNHPQMHGLIKVISGKMKVTSFSINTENTRAYDENAARMNAVLQPNVITAEKSQEFVVDTSSACCSLEPEARNLHELIPVGGPAAFIDILAPPYETVMDDNNVRSCTYYRELSVISEKLKLYRLQETNTPSSFWSDTYPYTGPKLKP